MRVTLKQLRAVARLMNRPEHKGDYIDLEESINEEEVIATSQIGGDVKGRVIVNEKGKVLFNEYNLFVGDV